MNTQHTPVDTDTTNTPGSNGPSRKGTAAEPSLHHDERARKQLGAFLAAVSKVDLPAAIRKNPYGATAVAGGAGFALGLTLGSRLVRMLVASVGMYTVSELLRQLARRTLDDLESAPRSGSRA